MRRVFLSEERGVGLKNVKQLGDDGGHPAEMAGTGSSIEFLTQSFDQHPGDRAWWIHLFDWRSEEDIDRFFFEQLAIATELTRILRQIFFRAELGGIHEDGNGNGIALRFGGAD